MKVFIGWSGDTSHKVALAVHSWLPRVIQTVIPYVSSEDIAKGARWIPGIAKELEASEYGIICVTKDNVNSPWINFEAGALSKEIEQSSVSPFLFNLKPSEINGPLSQFQHTVNEKDDLKKLLLAINEKKQHMLQKEALEAAFEMWWPQLETKLAQIGKEGPREPTPPKMGTDAMLEELLQLTRGLQKETWERVARMETIRDEVRHLNTENTAMFRSYVALATQQAELDRAKSNAFQAIVDASRKANKEGDSAFDTEYLEKLRKAVGRNAPRGMPPPPEPEPNK